VAYKIPCKNCDQSYAGKTGRPLGIKVKEHRIKVDSVTGTSQKKKRPGPQAFATISNHR